MSQHDSTPKEAADEESLRDLDVPDGEDVLGGDAVALKPQPAQAGSGFMVTVGEWDHGSDR
jgi:hypothetical protein